MNNDFRTMPITAAVYGNKRRSAKENEAKRDQHHHFSIGSRLTPEAFTALTVLISTKKKRRKR